jgi:uncharacterized protein YkwD
MRASSVQRRSRPFLEALEPRQLLAGYQPTAQEQLFLEELNDARANPPAYGTSIGVDLSGVAPSQPLAFNTLLIQASRDHSQDMNDLGYFDHNTPQGVDPGQQMTNAGFTWTSWGQSIAAGYQTPAQALQGLITDTGVSNLGHRRQLLAIDAVFQTQNQVGVGIVLNGSGPYSNYYTIDTASGPDTRPFITGVVFSDANNNGKYDIGEGLAGVTITVAGAGSTSTFTSGGYSLQVSPGTYSVTASGGAFGTSVTQVVTVGSSNVRLNFTPGAGTGTPPPVSYNWVGDFNGDGKKDLLGFEATTGNWYVRLSTGSGFAAPQLWDAWSPSVAWVDVHTGDFNGDGKTDIVGRLAATGQWFVAQSTGSAFFTRLWDAWSPSVAWVDINVGDFNGDGKADLVGRVQATGDWYVAQSNGQAFMTRWWDRWSPSVAWASVMVGDLTGDGRADIVGRFPQSGQWFAGLSTGNGFATRLWDAWSPGFTWLDVNLADLNGDGKADLVGRVAETGTWFASISTGFAGVSRLWDGWAPGAGTWVDVHVVDLNGDGKADLVGRLAQTGVWYAGLSTVSGSATQLWGVWPTGNDWSNVMFADFTGNGKADVESQMTDTGAVVVGVSGAGGFAFAQW